MQKQLYDAYRVYLFGVANLYANTKEEAEDILLEGFYRIFKDFGSYRGDGSLKAWMRKVMVNSALMYLRKYRRWNEIHYSEDTSTHSVSGGIDFNEEHRVDSILAIVRTLPELQRMVFSLKGIEGYSYSEISDLLSIKESTLRSHYLRARKKLQFILEKEID